LIRRKRDESVSEEPEVEIEVTPITEEYEIEETVETNIEETETVSPLETLQPQVQTQEVGIMSIVTKPVVKGWKAKLMWKTDGSYEEIGEAESCSIDIDMAIDDYLAIGQKQPIATVPGTITVSGTIDKAWVDAKTLSLFGASGDPTAVPVVFDIYAYRPDGRACIYIYNCYSESLSLDIPADDFLTESLDFRGQYFSYAGA